MRIVNGYRNMLGGGAIEGFGREQSGRGAVPCRTGDMGDQRRSRASTRGSDGLSFRAVAAQCRRLRMPSSVDLPLLLGPWGERGGSGGWAGARIARTRDVELVRVA